VNDKQFVDGMIVKRSDSAPEFVLANLSIKRGELIAFLDQQSGDWVNVVLKRAKSGKCYAELDTWKPSDKLADVARGEPPRGGHWEERKPEPVTADDEVPF
jgi:hypothetical protein